MSPGVPSRDLLLSRDHAVFIVTADGAAALVPVHCLVNGTTIAREEVDEITYWHVELQQHDVVFAEGLATESYLDTGNRSAFSNGRNIARRPADFAPMVWEAAGYAPLIASGPLVDAERKRLSPNQALTLRPCTIRASGDVKVVRIAKEAAEPVSALVATEPEL